jgi:hypothetical protein
MPFLVVLDVGAGSCLILGLFQSRKSFSASLSL